MTNRALEPAGDDGVRCLGAVLDIAIVDDLHRELCGCLRESRNVMLDASKVERVSTAALQVILAAALAAPKRAARFSIVAQSQSFAEAARDLAVDAVLAARVS